jgi:hypothetical protein
MEKEEKKKKKEKRKKIMIIQASKAITRYKNDTTLPTDSFSSLSL